MKTLTTANFPKTATKPIENSLTNENKIEFPKNYNNFTLALQKVSKQAKKKVNICRLIKFTDHFIKNLVNLKNNECKLNVVWNVIKVHSLFDFNLF